MRQQNHMRDRLIDQLNIVKDMMWTLYILGLDEGDFSWFDYLSRLRWRLV